MRQKLLLLLALFTASIRYTSAQPYIDVRTFSLRDGLAANVISGIGQTSDDLMWFGTWSGLCYFDGYRFTTFRDTPENDVLSSNRIYNIHPNSRGDIWVISYDRHLYLFDTHKCKYINIDNLLPANISKKIRFRKITSTGDGHTLVTGDDDSKISLLIDDNNVEGKGGIQIIKGVKASSTSDNKRTFTDSHKRVWTFSDTNGILLNDGKETRLLQAQPTSPSERTTSSNPFFFEDSNGTIWTVPTGGTFCYYNEADHKLVPYPLHTGETAVACIPLIKKFFVDKQRNLWIAGDRNLSLLKFRQRRIHRIPVVINQEVRALCVDRQGNIWAGDHEGALAVYDKTGNLKLMNSTFAKSVYAIMQDRKGRMWIGSKFDGLYCINNGNISHFTHNDKDKWSISHNDVYDIMEDTQGRIYVATYGGGINIIDEKDGSVRFVNIYNELKDYPHQAFLNARRVTSTGKGEMIITTNGGLVTFSNKYSSPNKIKFFTTIHHNGDDNSLASNSVMQTLVTKAGKVFVNITGGGIQEVVDENLLRNDLNMKNVNAVTSDEGLVQSMVEDNEGDIWLVRETTIDKYDVSHKTLYTFSPNDLGYNVEFSEAKPLRRADGEILMACNGCFIFFAPKDLVKSSFVPKIVFTSIQYQGEDKSLSILNSPELEIPSNKRSFTIFFSSLDYSDNSLIRYAYKLEGSDDKWNYIDDGHSASFNHIPHGHLKLIVRSTNADGVWQDNSRILEIYAHPTFWESWMGWLLYILIGGGLVFLAMYIYAQRQRMKMQTELSEMQTNFFTNIGHKLRTPLTLIGGPVTEVLKSEKLSEKGKELLNMVRRNSENMLNLVNSMLDYDHNPDNYLVDDTNAPFSSKDTRQEETGSVSNDSVVATIGDTPPANPDVKLLVVEDNSDLRRFLFTILSSDYSVLTAENGQEGLEKARKEMPDFIISDVMMPVMDGLTMVHELKQDKNTSHIPIIILSAKASMQDRLQGLHEGIDDYITKPFSATYLKERVANIIARRKSLQQEVLAQLNLSDLSPSPSPSGSGESPSNGVAATLPEGEGQGERFRLSSPIIIDEDKVLMDKLMSFLEDNIDNSELKVDDMASAVNLSRTVFYGKIKSIVGMPPNEFVRHIRLQRAEELIVKSKESFSQIAYSVGFADPKYFSRCFKKETGMLPSEYRAKATS